MAKKNAWIVEPELIDRFLEVLADDGYEWMTGHKANEFKPMWEEETILFTEEEPKTLLYMRYSTYLDDPDEEYNIAEVTEKWLDEMESEGATITIAYDDTAKPLCAGYNSGIISIDGDASNIIEHHESVNHPDHYNRSGIETIKIIEMLLTEEEYRGFLKGNILKYRERAPYKGNAEQDYAKAKWYFDELMTIGF